MTDKEIKADIARLLVLFAKADTGKKPDPAIGNEAVEIGARLAASTLIALHSIADSLKKMAHEHE